MSKIVLYEFWNTIIFFAYNRLLIDLEIVYISLKKHAYLMSTIIQKIKNVKQVSSLYFSTKQISDK